GLRIAAVRHVDVRLGNRIDFLRLGDCGGLARLRGAGGGGARRRSCRGRPEHRGRAWTGCAARAEDAGLEAALRRLLAPPGPPAVAGEKHDDAAEQAEIERVVEELVDDA